MAVCAAIRSTAASETGREQSCTRVHTVDLEPISQVACLVSREELQQLWADFQERQVPNHLQQIPALV
jgi:hypothetical protein